MFNLPLYPSSFSLDVSGLITYAEDIFNSLMPAFIPVIGIGLGIALVGLIVVAVSKAVTKKA